MKGLFRTIIPLAAAAVFVQTTYGQEAPPPAPELIVQQGPIGSEPEGPGFFRMELLGVGGFHGGKVVTGAPFTAVAVTTFSHALADGNKIASTHQVNVYRDSQGRFRRDGSMPLMGNLSVAQPHSFVVIRDPVAQKVYLLNPDKKIAHVMEMPGGHGHDVFFAPNGASPAPDTMPANEENHPNVTKESVGTTKESLGTKSINGVNAEGTRHTRVIQAGAIGNDKPITVTREIWYSPDLQVVVDSKHSDPRCGDTTYTLQNIQRTEPPANLFTVPSDYTVKEGGPHVGMMRKHMPAPPADLPPTPGL
jgi:hypothetical protein